MTNPRAALSVLAVGVAGGLGTVDLVGIRPDLPAVVLPLVITAIAACAIALAPPAVVRAGNSRVILGLLGSWLAWSYLSALTSEDPALAMATTASFVAVMLAAMGSLANRTRTTLVIVMAIAAIVHASAALITAFTVEFDQFPSRLSLVELEPNHLGRFLALSCVVSVLWALEQPPRRWPPALVFTSVCLLGLLLTGSRTAPTALVTAGFVALLAARRWRLLIVGGVAGAVVMAGLLASGWDARIIELTNRSGTELTNINGGNGRTTLWPEVLKVIDDHPATGIGLGVDRQRMRQINAETAISWDPQHAHNLVLHLAFTTGWVGAALFLSAMGLALFAALRTKDPWMGAIIAFVLVDGIAEPVVRIPQPTWVVLIGVVSMAIRGARTNVPASTKVPTPKRRRADLVDAAVGAEHDPLSSPLPFGPMLLSSSLVVMLAVTLVWQEPGEYPVRFRCRDEGPLDAAGLLIDVDPAAATVTLPQSVTPLPAEHLDGGNLYFEAGDRGIVLPSDVPRVVRCGAVREHGLTIDLDVATFALDTEGPGRILTLSVGPEWSEIDLHIGQERDGLSLRFRQSSTYRNDTIVPGIFTDQETHRIRVTVWSDRVEVSKNGALVETWTDFSPLKFDEWRNDRLAIMGNEATGDRPFVGTVSRLRIYEGQSVPVDAAS